MVKYLPSFSTVAQVLIDPADQNDWEATFTIDLPASRSENRVVLGFDSVKPLG